MHEFIDQSYHGFGRWKQCVNCGATRHSGLYWLGGYKSKVKPPCTINHDNEFKKWIDNALDAIDGEDDA